VHPNSTEKWVEGNISPIGAGRGNSKGDHVSTADAKDHRRAKGSSSCRLGARRGGGKGGSSKLTCSFSEKEDPSRLWKGLEREEGNRIFALLPSYDKLKKKKKGVKGILLTVSTLGRLML